MPVIQVKFKAKKGYDQYDAETIEVEAKESGTFTDSIELYIEGGTTIHVDKDELKKVVSILCD